MISGIRTDAEIDIVDASEIAQWMIDLGRAPPPDEWVEGMVEAQSFDWLDSF